MAYTLKSTGIATNLAMLVMAEEGGTAYTDIKEFVSSAVDGDMSVHADITVGDTTWKGTTVQRMGVSSSGYNPKHITFGTNKPVANWGSGFAVWIAVASYTSQTGFGAYWVSSGTSRYRFNGTPVQRIDVGGNRGTSDTTIPTATKFSMGVNYDALSNIEFFYGLESGALAADSTATDPGNYGSDLDITEILGATGAGGQNANVIAVAVFDRELTLSEFQSLHGDGSNDFLSTLFEASGTGTTINAPKGTLALTGQLPSLSTGTSPQVPVGALMFGGLLPSFVSGANIEVPVGALALAGLLPSTETGAAVQAPAGALTLTGLLPSADTGVAVQAPAGTLTLTGLLPSAEIGVAVQTPSGTITLNAALPGLEAGGASIAVPTASILLTGLLPDGYADTASVLFWGPTSEVFSPDFVDATLLGGVSIPASEFFDTLAAPGGDTLRAPSNQAVITAPALSRRLH